MSGFQTNLHFYTYQNNNLLGNLVYSSVYYSIVSTPTGCFTWKNPESATGFPIGHHLTELCAKWWQAPFYTFH